MSKFVSPVQTKDGRQNEAFKSNYSEMSLCTRNCSTGKCLLGFRTEGILVFLTFNQYLGVYGLTRASQFLKTNKLGFYIFLHYLF